MCIVIYKTLSLQSHIQRDRYTAGGRVVGYKIHETMSGHLRVAAFNPLRVFVCICKRTFRCCTHDATRSGGGGGGNGKGGVEVDVYGIRFGGGGLNEWLAGRSLFGSLRCAALVSCAMPSVRAPLK